MVAADMNPAFLAALLTSAGNIEHPLTNSERNEIRRTFGITVRDGNGNWIQHVFSPTTPIGTTKYWGFHPGLTSWTMRVVEGTCPTAVAFSRGHTMMNTALCVQRLGLIYGVPQGYNVRLPKAQVGKHALYILNLRHNGERGALMSFIQFFRKFGMHGFFRAEREVEIEWLLKTDSYLLGPMSILIDAASPSAVWASQMHTALLARQDVLHCVCFAQP